MTALEKIGENLANVETGIRSHYLAVLRKLRKTKEWPIYRGLMRRTPDTTIKMRCGITEFQRGQAYKALKHALTVPIPQRPRGLDPSEERYREATRSSVCPFPAEFTTQIKTELLLTDYERGQLSALTKQVDKIRYEIRKIKDLARQRERRRVARAKHQ